MSWQEPMKSQEKKWKSFLKKWDKQQWLVLLLLGLILLVMAIPTKKTSQRASASEEVKMAAADSSSYGSSFGSSSGSLYTDSKALTEKAFLEQQLEQLLYQVEGIGQVKVMLMLDDPADGAASFSSQDPSVSVAGVLIAAQGGDNPVAVRNIQEAVMALFQVEAHKIKVMKMK